MSSAGLLGISTSGLLAFQTTLQTIGHNIANANTEGYSRQTVDLSERAPSWTGGGYIGNGVYSTTISRNYDEFLTKQVRQNYSAHSQSEAYATMAKQIDDFVADPTINLSAAMQSFFDKVNDVATDPTSIAARQTLLAEATNLTDRFQAVNTRFNEIREQVNTKYSDIVTQINADAKQLAELNNTIALAEANGFAAQPNDLYDQRDQVAMGLAKKIGVTPIRNKNGFVDIAIGNGQPLVIGGQYNQLAVAPNRYDEIRDPDIVLVSQISSQPITKLLTGGELGGLIAFRTQALDSAQNAVGRISAALTIDFNVQHQLGYDLNDNTGNSFFSNPPSAQVSPLATNISTIQVDIDPASTAQLTTSDYRLDINAVGDYILTDITNNTFVASGTPAAGSIDLTAINGLTVTLTSGAFTDGDSFIIRPTRPVAGQMKPIIQDPAEVAAADGPGIGVGDNTNARALAGLQNAMNLIGGKSTYQDAFRVMVSTVGGLTRTAKVDSEAQQRLLDSSLAARGEVSGVNLDEEAANLMRYQQAYQASAQLVSEMNSMFSSLMSALRG